MERIPTITKDQFDEEVLTSDIPVIVDFSTDGCGPCELMNPILSELSEERAGEWKIVNHNVTLEELMEDTNEHIKNYDVMGFPTLIVFKDGRPVQNLIGIYDKEEIVSKIEEAL